MCVGGGDNWFLSYLAAKGKEDDILSFCKKRRGCSVLTDRNPLGCYSLIKNIKPQEKCTRTFSFVLWPEAVALKTVQETHNIIS